MEKLRKTIIILILLMIYVSVYALTHEGRGSGNYFRDENDLSLYINMWIPFCYFLLFTEKTKILKVIYTFGLILGLSAVVYSKSRGGFVGLSAVGFIIWLYSPNKLVTAAVIIFTTIVMLTFAGQTYWEEMSTVTDLGQKTATARIESWKAGWDMFVDQPFGVGGNNFQVWFDDYQTEYFKRGMWGRVSHSLWFTLIPELGIVGIIIYISLLYYNIRSTIFLKSFIASNDAEKKYIYYLSLSFLASIAGYFASGTFLSVLYYAHYWYLTAIIVVTINLARIIDAENNDSL